MAQLKYRKQDVIQLNFGLNIEGTSHQPSEVKLLVVNKSKTYGIVADCEDGQYKVEFDLGTIKDLDDDAKLDLVLEIHLNGRVFKPFKRQIEIIDYTEIHEPAEVTNQEIVKDIEHQDISEEKKPEPKKTPIWAKDIVSGTDIPPSLVTTDFSDVIKDVLKQPKKDEKVTIKFNKPTQNAEKAIAKLEIPPTDEIKFNDKLNKKKISKRKIQESFRISEGKIRYI